jgi:pimeloyl-ACP methyl ester carboxylesterase
VIDALLYFPSKPHDDTPGAFGLAHEDVEISTDDGQRLHAWWIPARMGPPLGHVLHFHGNAGNISHRLREASALTGAGFDVLLLDYRGYGRSTGRPDEEGLYLDARAARAAVVARENVDPSRFFYVGESLGGAVALALALEHPPRGLVLQSTFTGIRDMARLHYAVVPRFLVPDAYPACSASHGSARLCSSSTARRTTSCRSRTAKPCSRPRRSRSAFTAWPAPATTT